MLFPMASEAISGLQRWRTKLLMGEYKLSIPTSWLAWSALPPRPSDFSYQTKSG